MVGKGVVLLRGRPAPSFGKESTVSKPTSHDGNGRFIHFGSGRNLRFGVEICLSRTSYRRGHVSEVCRVEAVGGSGRLVDSGCGSPGQNTNLCA